MKPKPPVVHLGRSVYEIERARMQRPKAWEQLSKASREMYDMMGAAAVERFAESMLWGSGIEEEDGDLLLGLLWKRLLEVQEVGFIPHRDAAEERPRTWTSTKEGETR